MRSLVIAIPFALAVLTGACGKNSQPPPPSSGTPNAQQESGPGRPASGQPSQAQAMYNTVCIMCHGADGTGTGPAAASLNPKPRNYTDPAWQASVTDEQIKQIILKGGTGVGKSPLMPAQPQLENTPEVLDGLVKIIRGFGTHP
jgi:cytochrome c553